MYGIAAAFAGAAAALATSWSLGRLLLRRPVPAAVHLGAGVAASSVILFALLCLELMKPGVILGFAVVSAAAAWRAGRPGGPSNRLSWGWIAAGAPFAILYLAHALAPEIRPDGLSYHLGLPIEARRSGGFGDAISFFHVIPLGMETIFAAAFLVGGEGAAKLAHLSLLAASVPVLVALGELFGLKKQAGFAAALFYFVTPVVGVTAASTYNDAALTFFVLCVAYLVVMARRTNDAAYVWAAGLCAGFCYAIKFTGGLAIPAAALAIGWGWNFRAAGKVALSAAVAAGPWVLRSAWLTGNPVAPLFNHYFPNPYFHAETEAKLGQFLRDYGSVSWLEIPGELAIRGEALQGLLGPLWLLAPLGLLASGTAGGRKLWAMGALCGSPFLLNHGARFVMPALPFVALALMAALPPRMGVAAAALHGVLSWPAVTALYSSPGAWRLESEIPWRAALGLEDARAYQLRLGAGAETARMVELETKPDDWILDLADTPAAISRRNLHGYWQTALGDSLWLAIRQGMNTDRGALWEWQTVLDGAPLDRVRIAHPGPLASSWRINEIRLEDPAGRPIPARANWMFEASHHVEEAYWTMDGNLTTAWATWDAARRGAYLEAQLPSPRRVAKVRIVADSQSDLTAAGSSGRWIPLPRMNLRSQAIAAVRRAGFSYLIARKGSDAIGRIGADMEERPRDWGIRPVATDRGTALYSLKP